MSDLHEVNLLKDYNNKKKNMKFPDKVKIREIMTQRMQISEMFIHVFKSSKLGVVSLADCNHPTDGHKRFTLLSFD